MSKAINSNQKLARQIVKQLRDDVTITVEINEFYILKENLSKQAPSLVNRLGVAKGFTVGSTNTIEHHLFILIDIDRDKLLGIGKLYPGNNLPDCLTNWGFEVLYKIKKVHVYGYLWNVPFLFWRPIYTLIPNAQIKTWNSYASYKSASHKTKRKNLLLLIGWSLGIIFNIYIYDIYGINNFKPFSGSPISPHKALEEYQLTLEPLDRNLNNFNINEKFKLNAQLIEKLTKFNGSDNNSNYSLFKDFGVTEVVSLETGRIIKLKDERIEINTLTTKELSNIKKTAIEVLLFSSPIGNKKSGYESAKKYLYQQNKTSNINSKSTKNPFYNKIIVSPLNVDQEGYISLVFPELKLLLKKVKLCTKECPISTIETINFPEESFIKADFQKNLDKSQNNVIRWSSDNFLEKGINITYTKQPYSYFLKLIASLYQLLLENFGILVLSAVIAFLIIARKITKHIHIDQRQSVLGVGYSEKNIARQQGGTIINKTAQAKAFISPTNTVNCSDASAFKEDQLSQDIDLIAEEIRQLLKQLQQTHPIASSNQKEELALKVIKQIEKDSALKERVVKVAREIGIEELGDKINHPVASNFCELMAYLKII